MFGLFSNVIRYAGRTLQPVVNFRQFHALPTSRASDAIVVPQIINAWSLISLRTIVRDHFKKASEYKRLKTFGWRTKFKTRSGRRLLMRRILKGRFYLSH